MNNTVLCFHNLQTICIFPFPSFPTSLLSYILFLRKKSCSRNMSQKYFPNENKRMYGWNPQKPAKQDWNNTTTHSHHSYILPTMHNKKLSTHSQNEHGTQHWSLHSFAHKRNSISATFSSNKISQCNLKLPTHHTDPALLTVCAYKSNYTCRAQ